MSNEVIPKRTIALKIPSGTPNKTKYNIRKEVYIRDRFQCQDCKTQFEIPEAYSGRKNIEGLTLGHVIPKSLGGKFSIINLRAQCYPCNEKMGNQFWEAEIRKYITNY